VVAAWRQLKLSVWARRAKTRLKWVGIRLEVETGEGVVFVGNPLVLVGADPPGRPGSLTIRLGRRVRFAHGVTIEAEPGRHSLLEIGDGTRIGANTRFHLRGGSIRIGAGSEIRDECALTANGGEIELAERCFISYGAVLNASERIVIEERVALGDRVTLVDAAHVGANSHVEAGSLVQGDHPGGVLLAGVPAEIVKSFDDDE
jgi:acetyltransferase-like isoleucine patch superfamily enzyme